MFIGKNYLRIALCTSLFGTFLLVGCDSDNNDDWGVEVPDSNQVRYTFQEKGASSSKASVVETDDAMSFRWDESDQVTMWVGLDESNVSPYVFRTETGGVGSTQFEAFLPRETESLYYYGFYPAIEDEKAEVPVSVPVDGTIRQAIPDNSSHLAPYRVMFAPAVRREVGGTVLEGVSFKHLTSLFVFDITNIRAGSINVSEIKVKASQPIFYDRASYLPGSGAEEVKVISSPVGEATLTLGSGESGLWIGERNGKLRAFLPLIPTASLAGVSLSLAVRVDDRLLESLSLTADEIATAGVDRFLPGHYYHFYVDIDGANITWDMDKSIDAWELGGIVDIPLK